MVGMRKLINLVGSLITLFAIVFCLVLSVFIFFLAEQDPNFSFFEAAFLSCAFLLFAFFFYSFYSRSMFYRTCISLKVSRKAKKALNDLFWKFWEDKRNKEILEELKATIHSLSELKPEITFESMNVVPLRGRYRAVVGWECQIIAYDRSSGKRMLCFFNTSPFQSYFQIFEFNKISIETKSKSFFGRPAIVLEYKPGKFFKIESNVRYIEDLKQYIS